MEEKSAGSALAQVPKHLRGLAAVHPDYSLVELEESRALLYRYFEMAWRVFLRLHSENRLDEVLTEARKFYSVKRPTNGSDN